VIDQLARQVIIWRCGLRFFKINQELACSTKFAGLQFCNRIERLIDSINDKIGVNMAN
jgi:hypothetical protein